MTTQPLAGTSGIAREMTRQELLDQLASQSREIERLNEQLDFVKKEIQGDANFGELVSVLWDKPAHEAVIEIATLKAKLSTAERRGREAGIEEAAKFVVSKIALPELAALIRSLAHSEERSTNKKENGQ